MDIEAAQTGQVEHDLRQDKAICRNHHDVGVYGTQFSLSLGRLQTGWLADRESAPQRGLFDRAGRKFHAASGRAIRLRQHECNVMSRIGQGVECCRCKRRRARKDDAHSCLNSERRAHRRRVGPVFAGLFQELGLDAVTFEVGQIVDKDLA